MKIFFDVDTQNDFMNKDGALYVQGAEEIKPNLEKLTRHACENSIPVLGSVDKHFGTEEYKHREGELKRWGGPFPDHCMAGTHGQEKFWPTVQVLGSSIDQNQSDIEYVVFTAYVPNPLSGENPTLVPWDSKYSPGDACELKPETMREIIKEYISKHTESYYERWQGINVKVTPGIFFEKQQYDASTNPAFKVFLEMANVKEAVMYGVATDYCVRGAALAMRKLGIEVYLVTDAIAAVTDEGGRSALEEMIAAGVKPVTTAEVLRGEIK